jgi:hypothetical protein
MSDRTAGPRESAGFSPPRSSLSSGVEAKSELAMTPWPGLPRAVAAAIALAILAVGLSACGGGPPPSTNAPPDPYHYRQPFQAG